MKEKSYPMIWDVKRNWLFLSFLLIGCIPQFINRALYLWLFLVIFFWIRRTLTLNKNVCLILMFSFTYTLSRLIFNPPPLSIAIFYLLYPFIMYQCGIYLCRRLHNQQSYILILLGIIICYACWSISNNLYDYIETGAIVNPMRALVTDDINSEHFIPATQHNSMLSMAIGGLGIIFFKTNNVFQHRIKVIIIIISIISLAASLHLLNRSAIVIAAISLITGYCWSGLSRKKVILTVIGVFLTLAIGVILFHDNEIIYSIVDGFANRELSEDGSVSSGGDRFGRWIKAPLSILIHPLGSNGLYYKGFYVMVHNLWIDIGIDSGIVPFLLFFIITFRFYKVFVRFLKLKEVSVFTRGYVLLITIALTLQFAVEPILQAFHPLFYIFFFLWGLLTCLTKYKTNSILYHKEYLHTKKRLKY